jgi:hypothetical protein
MVHVWGVTLRVVVVVRAGEHPGLPLCIQHHEELARTQGCVHEEDCSAGFPAK